MNQNKQKPEPQSEQEKLLDYILGLTIGAAVGVTLVQNMMFSLSAVDAILDSCGFTFRLF